MIPWDLDYVRRVVDAEQLHSPVLELGVGYEGETCRDVIVGRGLSYYGTDAHAGKGVDFVVDFDQPVRQEQFDGKAPFGSVLVLNVLEHTFDPIRVLDNVFEILRPGGTCISVTPTVWPLHDYPQDVWRLLPQFYEQYCKRRGVSLQTRFFDYVGFGSVMNYRDPTGSYRFPKPGEHTKHYWYSKAVHKIFNTVGRGMFFPSHIAIGAVMQKG